MKRFGSLRRTERRHDEELLTGRRQSESACLSGKILIRICLCIEPSARHNSIDICLAVECSSLPCAVMRQALTVVHQIVSVHQICTVYVCVKGS